jgi:hypothetical protein
MGLEVGTTLAGTIGENSTAQQGAARIEMATRIPNDPLVVPPTGVVGLLLGLDLQGDLEELVAPVAQLVTVAALQHQKTPVIDHQPPPRLGHIAESLHVDGSQQGVIANLAQLNSHQVRALSESSGAMSGLRSENPQANRPATRTNNNHSGSSTWGTTRCSKSLQPTKVLQQPGLTIVTTASYLG